MGKLNIYGIETTHKNSIRNGITDFYNELYNNGNNIPIERALSRKCLLSNSRIKMVYMHPLP
jgi:hypothetical protein